jgi:hypothetical protein
MPLLPYALRNKMTGSSFQEDIWKVVNFKLWGHYPIGQAIRVCLGMGTKKNTPYFCWERNPACQTHNQQQC